MRLFFAVIIGMMCWGPQGLAQQDNVTTAVSALQDVLSNLKQSVQKLSLDNDELAARDMAIKKQVSDLQGQLGQLTSQGETLSKTADKLQDKNPRRAQAITLLEEENFDLDNRSQKAESGIKLIQQSLDAGYHETQRLLLQLNKMKVILPPKDKGPSPQAQALAHLQKEKLKLMKMIYESQQRQDTLHGNILAFQKNTALQPAASAMAHQQLLKEQIKDLDAQLAAAPIQKAAENTRLTDQWSDAQLHQLEGELTALERNYSQLKVLMGQMSKKAKVTVAQKVEGDKLQGNLEDLNRQAKGLEADLDDLRTQMVDLDKRKTRLEAMVQQSH